MARKTAPQPLHLGFARQFADDCRALGVEPPASLEKGFELMAVAEEFRADPTLTGLLELASADVAPMLVDLSVRQHEGRLGRFGLGAGLDVFSEQLRMEMREAAIPELERVVADLRPQFDELAQPLIVAAQRYGFTTATTSDEVINRADEGASAAWRNLRQVGAALEPIAALRRRMSEIFDVSPTRETIEDRLQPFGQFSVNYSVCFAGSENWSLEDGYVTTEQRTHLDWLALAVNGLRLNSPRRSKLG